MVANTKWPVMVTMKMTSDGQHVRVNNWETAMKRTEKSDTLARRDFLKGAGVAGAAGIATAALSGKEAQAALPETRKVSGYRETEHVMKYYELSRF